MKELIRRLLKESLDKIIKCSKCGWTWKDSESGPDKYFCHKCGHDNIPDNINETQQDNIVYHAGEAKITNLDPSKIKGGLRANLGWGVYFSSSLYKAKEYGKEITRLDISNLNILNLNERINDKFLNNMKKLVDETKQENNPTLEAFYDTFYRTLKEHVGETIWEGWRYSSGKFSTNTDKLWSNILLKLGYDGMQQGNYEYVIFNFDKANQYLS